MRTAQPSHFTGMMEYPTDVVKNLANLDTPLHELRARGHDIRYDKVKSLHGARFLRRDAGSKQNRAMRARRCEVHDPKLITLREIDVEPPAQPLVELLRAIDVRHGNDHDLQFHVDRSLSSAHV